MVDRSCYVGGRSIAAGQERVGPGAPCTLRDDSVLGPTGSGEDVLRREQPELAGRLCQSRLGDEQRLRAVVHPWSDSVHAERPGGKQSMGRVSGILLGTGKTRSRWASAHSMPSEIAA